MKNNILNRLDLLNSYEYLYLNNLVEGDGNILTLTVNPGSVCNAAETLEISGVKLDGLHDIIHDTSVTYKIVFSQYILYLVRNESFSVPDEGKYQGKLFRPYIESSFINNMQKYFFSSESILHHYQIVCCDHIIDIISEH